MTLDDLNSEVYSYKDFPGQRYNESQFILAVKDEEFPDRNLIPILYYDRGKISELDTNDMSKIVAVPQKSMDVSPFSERIKLSQFAKIGYGNIIVNERALYNSNIPKCKTFESNIFPLKNNEVVEVFKGELEERKSRIKIEDQSLETLIVTAYTDTNVPFFVENDEAKMYGPFKAVGKDAEGYILVEKNSWKIFGEYKNDVNNTLQIDVNNSKRKIIIPSFNPIDLVNELDFKSDVEIIEEFKYRLKENSNDLNPKVQEELFKIFSQSIKQKSLSDYINKNNRIKSILSSSEQIIISNKELANVVPEIKNIKKEIEILQNQEFEWKKKVDETIKRKDTIEQNLDKKLVEVEVLNKQLEDLQKTKEQGLLKVKSELESEINKLNSIKEKLEISIQIETLEKSKELQDLKTSFEKLQTEKDDLDYTVQKLRLENTEAQRNSQQELINLFRHKKYFDFLSGRDLSEQENKDEVNFRNFSTDTGNLYEAYTDFRNAFIGLLNKSGRNFETHFVDNLLISLHQNTLTIFAGLPGTGKTSLARIVSQILSPLERICEVSVSRGWTSQKDLLGFQNPLTNKFHSAPTGIYELLRQLDFETKTDYYLSSPLAYVILDEANLSPIEHYWSTFYNLTDSHARKDNFLKISVGNNSFLEFANNLRFVATINYDQTTENLSPRVIDRANIIQIPNLNSNINELFSTEIESLTLSFEKSKSFFGLLDFEMEIKPIDLPEELEIIFDKLKRDFKKLLIPISHRVEIAIKRYCYCAKSWMKETSRPLDYCVAQRMLPLINLQGDSVKTQLQNMFDFFVQSDLKISAEILKKIIEYGSQDGIYEGTYNYFLTLSHA